MEFRTMALSTETAGHPLPLALFDDPKVRYVRVFKPGEEPPEEKGVVDVAVLDMNHGYPNLGHASIVETLLNIGHLNRLEIGPGAPEFRVISFDLRGGLAVPVSHPSRFPVIVGTGGPGSLDPRENDGKAECSQGILEDPTWEAPLWHFFDQVAATPGTSLLGICHSFGLLSRWSGVAESVLRPVEKGGKSSGVVTNFLTDAASRHPWFKGLFSAANGSAIEVLDSRLYDLIPTGRGGADTLSFESSPGSQSIRGEAVTMMEFARDGGGILPRIWGVNHHPEIGDKGLQRERLARLESWGTVTPEWLAERRAALNAWNESALTEKQLQWTASYTFEKPLMKLIRRALANPVS